MADNDRIILNQVLEQQRQALAPTLDVCTYFEIFTAEQVLKDYDLSYDEIESGIVAGGGDGGIDGFYTFINGELLQEDTDVSDIRKNIQFEIFVLQAKTSSGYSEAAMDHFISAAEDLFDLSKPLNSFKAVYNKDILEAIGRFRDCYQRLASKFPRLRMKYIYATKGDQIHPNVSRKKAKLLSVIKNYFSSADSNLHFLAQKSYLTLLDKFPL